MVKLSDNALKNKIKYNTAYDKEHYIRFVTRLKKDEYNEIDAFIKSKNISKADFLRQAYDKLKNTK